MGLLYLLVHVLVTLFTVSAMTPDQLHVNAVAKAPKSVDELAQAKSELEGPLSKAFTNTLY